MPLRVLVLASDLAASAAPALERAGYEVVAADASALDASLAAGGLHACVVSSAVPPPTRSLLAGAAPLVLVVCDGGAEAVSDSVPVAASAPLSAGPEGILAALRHLAAARPMRRVLVVDDSEMTARLIGAELEGKGLEVSFADSVEQATRAVLKKSTRPNLILLDVNMPGVDGLHFCRFIKGNSLFRDIKVVLCSGMDAEQLRAAAETSGADGFVPKDSFLSRWVLDEIERPAPA